MPDENGYFTTEEAVRAAREHLRARRNGDPYKPLYLNGNLGLSLTAYGIAGRPGGYSLAHWYDNTTLILGVDFAFELPDESLNQLRDIVYTAMVEEGLDFIPLSYNAFSRLHVSSDTLQLVERDGRQCIFSGIMRRLKMRDGEWETVESGRQYYISGYDANEDPPLYFLARLPHEVTSYKDAIEALKPESVKLAEAQGLEVLRQGDMFAIPTKYSTNDLLQKGAVIEEYKENFKLVPTCSLYGTGHCTEKMARLPDGTQLGRGMMMHRPGSRRPDHQDLPLSPSKWYIIVKNTVPIQEPT
jgi:hypothetical protein